MGYEGIRGRTGARAWEVIHIYTGSFTPSPDPTPLLPPPDLDKEGRVDNQRDTPPNTRLTVQPIRATSSALSDQARKFLRGGQVVAVLDLLNVKSNGKLIRHGRLSYRWRGI